MHPNGHAERRRQAGSRPRRKAKVPARDAVYNHASLGQQQRRSPGRIDRFQQRQSSTRQKSLAGRYANTRLQPYDQCLPSNFGIQYHPTLFYFILISFVVADNKILNTLGQCEPEMLTTVDILWPEGDASSMDPSLRILCTLSELYDRELVAAIGWAKQIPGEILNFSPSTMHQRIWELSRE